MSDLQSIIDNNLTEIVEKTVVNVELVAALKKRGLVGRDGYLKLTKFQRDENHSDGALYIHQTIVPALDKAGEISFVEALKEGNNYKVVEILINAGFGKTPKTCNVSYSHESGTISAAKKTDIKSVVKSNLTEIVNNTKITVELCLELEERNLVLKSEREELDKYQKAGQHSQGASYLFKNVLPVVDEKKQLQFLDALVAGGNGSVAETIRCKLSGGTIDEPNLTEVDGFAFWKKENPNKRFALLINVVRGRPGVEENETRLSKTLQGCGFYVKIVEKKNRTAQNLLKEVDNFCEKVSKVKNVDGIFVALMSHGYENTKFMTEDENGRSISIEKIIEEFSSEKRSNLEDVPKVFLINICRGERRWAWDSVNQDEPTELFNWTEYWNRLFENSRCAVDALCSWETHVVKDEFDSKRNPTWKTFYFGFSTQEGTPSYRYNRTKTSECVGAWFVIDFCDVLNDKILKREPTPIATIFAEAKQRVEYRAKQEGLKDGQKPIHYDVAFKEHMKFQLPKP